MRLKLKSSSKFNTEISAAASLRPHLGEAGLQEVSLQSTLLRTAKQRIGFFLLQPGLQVSGWLRASKGYMLTCWFPGNSGVNSILGLQGHPGLPAPAQEAESMQ